MAEMGACTQLYLSSAKSTDLMIHCQEARSKNNKLIMLLQRKNNKSSVIGWLRWEQMKALLHTTFSLCWESQKCVYLIGRFYNIRQKENKKYM
jgi:hypothetical protein